MREQIILGQAFRIRTDYLANIDSNTCRAALAWLKRAQIWAYRNKKPQALEILTSYLAECKNHRPAPYQPRPHAALKRDRQESPAVYALVMQAGRA